MIDKYKTWIFDCDGVLLNSNEAKANAIYNVCAERYGAEAADKLIKFHKENGGISRQKQFVYLFTEVLDIKDYEVNMEEMLIAYGKRSLEELIKCEEAPKLRELLQTIKDSGGKNFVVSGGEEKEVISALRARGLADYFAGIFGAPTSKIDILNQEFSSGAMEKPAVFIGDSKYDYETANHHDIDFIFISGWTAFKGWQSYFSDKDVIIMELADDILNKSTDQN